MEVIIHIGMPKTGTTSLQSTLHRNRDFLLGEGILYPELSKIKHAHHLLMPLFTPPDRVWSRVKSVYGTSPSALLSGAKAEWESILEAVRTNKPEKLILSTEAFFVGIFPKKMERLRDMILDVSSSVRVVGYVRSPESYYRSILLERAKRPIPIRPPEPIIYRRPIEQFESAFSTSATINIFNRKSLYGGDISIDFLKNVMGAAPGISVSKSGNVSLSPEAMLVFREYMFGENPNQTWGIGAEQAEVLRSLKELELELMPRSKTRLYPELERQIRHVSSDTAWLKDRYGIDFLSGNNVETGTSESSSNIMSLRDAFDMDEEYIYEIASEFVERKGMTLESGRRLMRRTCTGEGHGRGD
jgi:hypothetical protein